ncbi:MAG TPA: hypothetical protein VII03_05760 [Solirubrobacteraceae bacterium]
MSAAACQSTEQESAKIAGEAKAAPAAGAALKLGAPNHSVHVSQVTLLSDAGRLAVAAKLTNTSSRAQVGVPLLVSVTGKGGKVIYSNEAAGVEASLQRIALLRAHQSAWWVDDQVLTSQPALAAKLRVGSGPRTRSSAYPELATSAGHSVREAGISTLSASLVNHSSTGQSKVPVFGVALRGGRVVAAGRAVIAALPARRGASVAFQIVFVGNPTGATVELSPVPSAG